MAPGGSSQPRPTLDRAHHWYPVVEQVRTCRIQYQLLESLLKRLHHDNLMEADDEKEQLLICKDVRDRFEMWCASFDVRDQNFDRSLRKSMGIAGVVFTLFNTILALLDNCKTSLL